LKTIEFISAADFSSTEACEQLRTLARAVGRPKNELAKCLVNLVGPRFASKEAAMQSIREPAA